MTGNQQTLGVVLMGLMSVLANGQSARFHPLDNGEWVGFEYRCDGFTGAGGATSGSGVCTVYDGDVPDRTFEFTWEIDGDDLIISYSGGPSRTYLGGAAYESGDIEGTNGTWVNIDFL